MLYRRIATVDDAGHADLLSPNTSLPLTPLTPSEQASSGFDVVYFKWIFRVEAVSDCVLVYCVWLTRVITLAQGGSRSAAKHPLPESENSRPRSSSVRPRLGEDMAEACTSPTQSTPASSETASGSGLPGGNVLRPGQTFSQGQIQAAVHSWLDAYDNGSFRKSRSSTLR